MKTSNEGHIEEAGELSRVPGAMLRRKSVPDNGLDLIAPVGACSRALENGVDRYYFILCMREQSRERDS
jgi:hypothetical protein